MKQRAPFRSIRRRHAGFPNFRAFPRRLFLLAILVMAALPAAATVRYVKIGGPNTGGTTWATAYATVDQALAAAAANDEIWIKEGTYTPATIAGYAPSVAVKIYGGFAGTESATTQRVVAQHPTILSGDLGGNDSANFGNRGDNAGPVVTTGGAGTWLDGLIIKSGYGTAAQIMPGGLYVNNANNCVATNCVFLDNSSIDGGAIIVRKSLNFQASDCIFSGNRATQPTSAAGGGGAVAYGFNSGTYSVFFSRCIFSGNTCSGAAGEGGAVSCYGGSWTAGFTNCLVVGNTCGSGGYGGGGFYMRAASAAAPLVNCTFSGNSPYAISPKDATTISLKNCIAWGNVTGEINTTYVTPPATYCDINQTYSGTGNIKSTPGWMGNPLQSGTWTADGAYNPATGQTTLTMTGAGWTAGSQVGRIVNPDTGQNLRFYITGNTATTLLVWGDASSVRGIANSGDAFAIYDYHSASVNPCKDVGTNTGAPGYDLDGVTRPQNSTTDMGVYEYITYTITYNGNGNTGGTAPVDGSSPYPSHTTVTLLGAGSLARTGYAFAGWNTAANGSGTSYSPADTLTLAANTTLYAQWAPTYTLTYGGNGNTGGTAPVDGSSPYNYNATVTVLDPGTLARAGYAFASWNTAANGSGTSYSQSDTFAITVNTVLYAQWTVNSSYAITYSSNGGTGSQSDPSSPYSGGATVTVLDAGSMARTGYTFAGWNTATDGSGTSYGAGDTFAIGANTTLYAQWTINQYAVIYDGNGSTGGTAPVDADSPYNYNTTVTVLGAGTLTKTGYTFTGWNMAANGSGTSYSAAATFAIAANTTLYAQWTINQYPVIYNGNGNTGGTAPFDGSSPYNYNTTVTVLGVGTLTKTGYTYANWNTAANGSGTSYSAGNTFAIAANTTLYAQWTINTYTLTYYPDAHSAISGSTPQTVGYGGSGTAVTVIPNTGYGFASWSDGSTANPRTDANVAANLTVTANCVPLYYVDASAVGTHDGSSWANAFTTLTGALAAVASGQLWVREGIYKPGAHTTDTFQLKSGVALYGGFAGTESTIAARVWRLHPTILSGDLGGDDSGNWGHRTDNAAHVVTGANGTTLDGFVISGGYANGASGPGLYLNGTSPTIRNCIFTGNRCDGAGDNGGAAYIIASAAPAFANCVFSDNYAGKYGGAVSCSGASPTFDQCVFAGGVAPDNGGAMYFDGVGAPLVQNSLLAGNYGNYSGAVRADGSAGAISPKFTNCTFGGNRAAQYSGAVWSRRAGSTITLVNCIAYANSAVFGDNELTAGNSGVMNLSYTDYAANNGGTLGSGTLNNQNPQFAGGPGGTWLSVGGYNAGTRQTTLTASGAPGWTPGAYMGRTVNANTGQYLQFAIAANGADTITVWGDATQVAGGGESFAISDYHIGSGSPCKNTGTNTGAPATDLDGVTRPQSGTTDMGAYEYIAPVAITVTTVPAGWAVTVDGSLGTTPLSYNWLPGSAHALGIASPQSAGAGTRYAFGAWSDSGAQEHTLTVGGSATLTATLNKQYQWSVNADPLEGGTVLPVSGGWYNDGATFTAAATTNMGWAFSNWSGDLSGAGTNLAVTMSSPIAVAANFIVAVGAHQVTVNSSPSGRDLLVDSNPTTGFTYAWDDGTVHTLNVASATQSGGAGIRYVWQNWSDAGAQSHDVTSLADTTITANFQTQFQWTLNVGAGGNATPASAWYASGSLFTAAATPDPGYRFVGWSGGLSGTDPNLAVTVSGPLTVSATFTQVHYVDQAATGANNGSSWANAYTSLQGALAAVSAGELWVAAGTYKPGTLTTDTFQMKSGVTLYGGFAATESQLNERVWQLHPTILSGDLNGDDTGNGGNRTDNALHVVTGANNATLDGFVVSGGYGAAYGAGISLNGVSPVISNCVITANMVANGYNGGAVWIANGSAAVIANCTFSDNFAGIAGSGSGQGGAVSIESGATPTIDRCVFAGSSGGSAGGAMWIDPGAVSPVIRNCLFAGNQSGYGGGLRIDGGSGNCTPQIVNCTFSGNNDGGLAFKRLCSPQVKNCMLWADVSFYSEVGSFDSAPTPTVTYSDVQGGYTGTGNQNVNPNFPSRPSGTWAVVGSFSAATRQTTLTASGSPGWTAGAYVGLTVNPDTGQSLQFAIAANGVNSLTVWGDATRVAAAGETFQIRDYHLGASSPRDNATNLGAPAWDLDGVARPQNAVTDMGAYEYIAGVGITVDTVPSGLAVIADGSVGTAPLNFTWLPGSTHTVSAPTPQLISGSNYVFTTWSDAGACEHTLTVTGAATVTATFRAFVPTTVFSFR